LMAPFSTCRRTVFGDRPSSAAASVVVTCAT
jgi:hypothetical protein